MQREVVECSLEQLAPVIQEILKEENSFTIRVTGNSMLPLWRDKRDLVTLAACKQESLRKRDIVLYRREMDSMYCIVSFAFGEIRWICVEMRRL